MTKKDNASILPQNVLLKQHQNDPRGSATPSWSTTIHLEKVVLPLIKRTRPPHLSPHPDSPPFVNFLLSEPLLTRRNKRNKKWRWGLEPSVLRRFGSERQTRPRAPERKSRVRGDEGFGYGPESVRRSYECQTGGGILRSSTRALKTGNRKCLKSRWPRGRQVVPL